MIIAEPVWKNYEIFKKKIIIITRILFYKHRCKRRPSPEISRLDGRCLKSVLRFDYN